MSDTLPEFATLGDPLDDLLPLSVDTCNFLDLVSPRHFSVRYGEKNGVVYIEPHQFQALGEPDATFCAVVNKVDPTKTGGFVNPYNVVEIRFLAVRAALDKFFDGAVPEPTIVVRDRTDESQGYGLWKVENPLYDPRYAKVLANKIGGQAQGESFYIPVPRAGELVHFKPSRTYTFEEAEAASPVSIPTGTIKRWDLQALKRAFPKIPNQTLVAISTGEDDKHGAENRDNTRSGYLFRTMMSLANAQVPDEIVYAVLTDPSFKISAPLLEQGKSMNRAFQRQYERAKSRVAPLDQLLPANTHERTTPQKPANDQGQELKFDELVPLPDPIPPRDWLFPDMALSRVVTIITGKGGEGKSLFTLQLAVAAAAHIAFAHWSPSRRARVLYINNEDDTLETQRRLAAICAVMNVNPNVLEGKLVKLNAADIALVEKKDDGQIYQTKLWGELLDQLEGFELVVIDPLIELHRGLDENSNSDMKEIIIALRTLALLNRIPIMTVHHSRKNSAAGEQDSARGGSAIVNASRIVKTMERMTEEEHVKINPPLPKERYVRVTDAKQNYAGRVGDRWLQLVPVDLTNGETAPAFTAVEFGARDPASWEHLDDLRALVRRGQPDGTPWMVNPRARRETRLDTAVMDRFRLDAKDTENLLAHLVTAEILERVQERTAKGDSRWIWHVKGDALGDNQTDIPF